MASLEQLKGAHEWRLEFVRLAKKNCITYEVMTSKNRDPSILKDLVEAVAASLGRDVKYHDMWKFVKDKAKLKLYWSGRAPSPERQMAATVERMKKSGGKKKSKPKRSRPATRSRPKKKAASKKKRSESPPPPNRFSPQRHPATSKSATALEDLGELIQSAIDQINDGLTDLVALAPKIHSALESHSELQQLRDKLSTILGGKRP